jgi:hypothetical protein
MIKIVFVPAFSNDGVWCVTPIAFIFADFTRIIYEGFLMALFLSTPLPSTPSSLIENYPVCVNVPKCTIQKAV